MRVGEQETVVTHYLQIVRFHKKSLQPYVKKQIQINEPVHWSAHQVRQDVQSIYKHQRVVTQYLVQDDHGSVVLFTRGENEDEV